MFSFRFYNSVGSVSFGGGSSDFPWRLTAADGLALTGKTFTTASYAGVPGQVTTDTAINARTITLAGDILVTADFQERYAAALGVLFTEGTLELELGSVKRKIKCKCSDFAPGERNGAYQIYVIQFIADYPFFSDLQDTTVPAFNVASYLNSTFTFPGVFSARISRVNINYIGSVKTEPIFVITVENAVAADNNLLTVTNHTTGECIKLNYQPTTGKTITIDVDNRKIFNAAGDNLISYITDDTFLDGFHLVPGENDIEVTNANMNTSLAVMCKYSNKYVEAVY